jgi:hypothetical protein
MRAPEEGIPREISGLWDSAVASDLSRNKYLDERTVIRHGSGTVGRLRFGPGSRKAAQGGRVG